jgi:hypothetical protein
MFRAVIRRATKSQRPRRRLLRSGGFVPFWGVLVVALATSGCGYHFVRYAEALGDYRSLAIRTPSNGSFDPGVEFTVANALRREALRRGGLTLVEDAAHADIVLSGRVLPIRTLARSVSSVVLTLEYEITLRLDLEARTRAGRAIPLDSGSLQETERYLASANVEVTRKNREEALRLLASTIANRVYDHLYAGLTP